MTCGRRGSHDRPRTNSADFDESMTASRPNSNYRKRSTLPPPLIVDNATALGVLQEALRHIPRLAVDTESNSLFAYQERVCLIQLSTDSADYVIDPLELNEHGKLDFLGEILVDPRVEKVLHAAEYDVMTLRRDFGFSFANLFDTMIAARILGWERVGLGALLEEHFGITLDKRHQRANWGKRPLRPDMIRYAQMDTHYLLPLSDIVIERLRQGGHLEEARELFDEVARSQWSGSGVFDPQGFWRINGANTLKPREVSVLEAVYLYRENEARNRDLPVFKVLPDHALVHLASARPRSLDDLHKVTGLTEGLIRQFGEGILKAVEQGMQATPPSRPQVRNHTDEVVHKRYEALHAWRKERAARRGVSSEVVMPRDALWELAEAVPRTRQELERIKSIGPWRAKTYGDELLELLAQLQQQ